MSKYIKNLPIFLYPYAYLILILGIILIGEYEDVIDLIPHEIGSFVFWGIIFGFNIYCLIRSIINTVLAAKGKITLKDMAKLNMLIKLVHIPAYLFNFALGCAGLLLSIWGLGFIIVAVLADLFTIITTGVNAIGLSIALSKEKVTGKGLAILYGILNFIYCADVAVAIIEFIQVKKHLKSA